MSIRNPLAPPANNPTPATIPARNLRRSTAINNTNNTTAAIAAYIATGCTRNPPLSGVLIAHGRLVGIPASLPSKNLPKLSIAASTAAQGAHASNTRSNGSFFHRRYATTTSPVNTIPKVVNEGSTNNATGSRRNAWKFPTISNNREHTKAAITANSPASQTCSLASPAIRAVLRLKPTAATKPTAAQSPYTDRRTGPSRTTPGIKIAAV